MIRSLFLIFVFGFSLSTFGQSDLSFSSLDKSPLDVVMHRDDARKAIARVIYSRPAKRNRTIFGKLVPYNEVWRTGANEATEITFYQPVIINQKTIPAGSYSIYTIPNKNNWEFILNKKTTQWGSDYDPEMDLISCEMDLLPSIEPIESFSISFVEQYEGFALFLGWDDTIAKLPIALAPVEQDKNSEVNEGE